MISSPTLFSGGLSAWLAALSPLLSPALWAAQAAPEPLDARAAVPALVYVSPLLRYKPLDEAKP